MAPSVADIARWLEELPTTVAGWAVIEVADETEQIPLTAPGGVEIRWLHRDGRPPGTGDALERTVRALPVPTDEQVYVWMAGEAASLEPLRHWVRRELRLDARDHDIRGYWKRGVADYEDDHDHEDSIRCRLPLWRG